MRYSAQAKFFEHYLAVWLLCALAVTAALVTEVRHATSVTVLSACVAICAYLALAYLPKYLSMHREPEKRFTWSVRVRWILIATDFVVGLAFARTSRQQWAPMLLGVAWLLLVNLFVKRLFRDRAESGWMPWVYFVADAWLAVCLILLNTPAAVVGSVFALTVVLCVLVDEKGIIGILGGAIALMLGSYVVAALVLTAWLLVRISAKQADKNYHQTIADLSAFTGMSLGETRDRLMSSRDMLVQAWKDARLDESDTQALAEWYAANSLSYLFDIARFHLTYKHIAFTLDVIDLSLGRCLDYGAGKGELSIELARRGKKVTYYDVPGTSRKYAEWSAARDHSALLFTSTKDELRAITEREGKFATIISLDVLEHLPDLPGELEFLDSVLAPGGRMIMTVPFGATESHPMHLSHQVDTRDFLAKRGLQDAKGWRMKLAGSEILRKRECVIYEKPIRASVSDGSAARR